MMLGVDVRRFDPAESLDRFKTNSMIESEIRENRFIDLRSHFGQSIMEITIDTEGKMIHEALIKLGWTPPATANSSHETAD